ncbi:hypothetical protein GGF46_003051 [Coemansia sp. RSA 552]|nr:hypothetical protein GGF46_003051 [Coemansia sp. RSA 552]
MSMTVTELPHKEQSLFRTTLKLYEARQYKKGLKTAEQILAKFPSHGESLAVKGLFLAHMDRKDEGYAAIKKGLDINPQSSISWHMYGLVCRVDQKFTEAIRCYEEALKGDSENAHILRELGQLQMHMRMYTKAIDVRARLVKLNPHPQFWIALAVSHQMAGHPDQALKVVTTYEGTLGQDPSFGRVQTSELLMYKAWLMELQGSNQQALDYLKEIRARIADVSAWKEMKARLLLAVGRKEAAATAYQDLIERNAENNDYIIGYLACNGLDMARSEDHEAIIEVIDGLRQLFPTSNRLRFLPLTFSSGDSFRHEAEALAKYALRKGIPSLFSTLKSLYADPAKAEALGSLMESLAVQLADKMRFADSTQDEPPSALVWCKYYLAQHHDYHGEHARALTLVDEAISLDGANSAVELKMTKARILKHAGDIVGARDTMEAARLADDQDRYINTKAVKYMLRNNEVDLAERTMVMFVRDDAPHKVQEIVDIQAIWYMCERGHAFQRLGDFGRALKNFQQVVSSFDAYYLDQFDFHSYSIRKATVRTYVEMLNWEDTVYAHPIFADAAAAAIACHLQLHELSEAGTPFAPISLEHDSKPLTRNGAAQQGAHNVISGSSNGKVAEVDKDPSGASLVDTDQLAAALKLVDQLAASRADHPETHQLAFEVHLRMHKYFLVLKAINVLRAIDADHPALPVMAARLDHALDADSSFAAPMKAALKGQLSKSFPSLSIASVISANPKSLPLALEGAKGLLALSDTDGAKKILLQAASPSYGDYRTLSALREAGVLLREKCKAPENELAEFTAAAKQVFPLSTCF